MYLLGIFFRKVRFLICWIASEEEVKRTKGFVLQIQQGATHEKSPMQVAEEKQSGWLQVPRIAVWSFEVARTHVGGSTYFKDRMEKALKQAEEQWRNGVWPTLQMCSERYEAVDGGEQVLTGSDGRVHGRAKVTFPSGNVYVGDFQHGKPHGKGTFTWADGAVYDGEYQDDKKHGKGTFTFADGRVYDGEWQDGKRHGKGKYTYADGNFELGFYVDNKDSGEGVKFTKDRQQAWLLKDGKVVRELSPSEAAKTVRELGLSELLKWFEMIWGFEGEESWKLSSCPRSEPKNCFLEQSRLEFGFESIVLSHVSIFKKRHPFEIMTMKGNSYRGSSQGSFRINMNLNMNKQ